jgi:hypothetical protein
LARREPTSARDARSLHNHRELRSQRLRLAADFPRELFPRSVHVDVVRDERTADAQRLPRRPELEAHALVGVLAVVHEEVDLAETLEQRRQFLLRSPEHELPAVSKRRRHHPPRLLARWDHGAALPIPERPGLVLLAGDLREVDRVQLAFAVVLQGQQEERRRDAVADAGLDGDAWLQLAQQPVEAESFVVAVAARDAAGVVPVPTRGLALNGVPELRCAVLEMVDQGLDGGHRDGIVITRIRLSSSGR